MAAGRESQEPEDRHSVGEASLRHGESAILPSHVRHDNFHLREVCILVTMNHVELSFLIHTYIHGSRPGSLRWFISDC